jgi:hypothetical protein
LREHDGPTLQHALQGLHHESILLPRRKTEQPSKELLEERYERFRGPADLGPRGEGNIADVR